MLISRKMKIVLKILTYLTLVLFTLFCLFPFIWMALTALRPREEIRSTNPTLWIENPTLENITNVLTNTPFLTFFQNSVIVAFSATFLSIVVSIFSGYTLSRFMKYSGVKLVSFTMLLSQMVPPVLLLIPLYVIMNQYGILNTHLSLIVAYTTFTIPLCSFMLTSFFASIPTDLEEAAEMDGCSKIATIIRIVLPISIPGVIATGLYAFVNAWNEFMFGYVFINDSELTTLTPGIMLFQGIYGTDWGSIMSASVLSVLPVLVVFVYIQRYLIEGMAAGAVKG
ncbi:carbohydrate ABC transporter permease [Salibacterium aidingense]|uniref:carbohydrate ABC transporter permease n=1 Tax=Salibacterium aidingense TaxID=384933 RepID=UPI0003F559D6|nr:carbohydrate ABC transporter permease [Salibacterium aidingense]